MCMMSALYDSISFFFCANWLPVMSAVINCDLQMDGAWSNKCMLVFVVSEKTNELWVLNNARFRKGTIKDCRSKEASILWSHHEVTRELPEERDNARNNARCTVRRRGRPRIAWMDNIKTWTGLTMEESIKMAEDRDKWRKYVHGVANS